MAPRKMPGGDIDKTTFFRNVEQWLRDNPGKSLREWRQEIGYTGPALKQRGGVGEIRVSYKGKSATAAVIRQANEVMQRAGQDVYGKGVVAPKGSGLEEHHKRVIAVYQPFFEGLEDKEKKELAQWFVDEGYGLGNVKGNLEALSKEQHKSIHDWMKDNYIQPKRKPLLDFKGVPLNERLPAALLYLENVQPAVDEQLKSLMPNRNALRAMAAAGLAAPSILGTAASAAETTGRVQLARQTNNPVDWAQAGLAGASSAGDIAGYTGVGAIPGEVVSTVADLANVAIDTARTPAPRPSYIPKAQARPRTATAARTQGQAMPKPSSVSKPLNLANEAQYFIVNPIRSAFDRVFGNRGI